MTIAKASQTRTMTGWRAVAEALRAEGVAWVFGLPGDPRHLYDDLYALQEDGGAKPFGVRYETSGAFMAMAYARASGQIAACFGCPGPGVANLIPGVLEAFSGCTPMLVLSVRASQQTNGMGAFQETDHLGMMRPITKWATTVETVERVPWTIRRAIQVATSGQPGPVYVELPADVAMESAHFPPYRSATRQVRPGADIEAVAAAADLIAAASKPLLIIGGGAVLSGAGPACTAFSTRFGIPIQTTPAGRGAVPETHELFCGLVGLYRTTFPREVYEESDLIITVGSRMEEFQGGFLPLPAAPKIVQIDIEPFEFGRNWVPDVAIQADATLAITALHRELERRQHPASIERTAEISQRHHEVLAAARADAEAAIDSGSMPMSGKSIVSEINRVFGHDTVIVKENGGQDLWVYYWPYYQVLDAGCCVPPAEQTAMGYGIIGAMAVKLAMPDHKVVSTSGDGAFQMSIHELGTAAQNNLGVTWVVMDDGAFGWVQWIQRRDLDSRIVATDFHPEVDLVAVAKACNCEAERISHPKDLGAALERAVAANARDIPYVIVVPVDQAHHHAEFDRFHDFVPAADSATV